MIAEILNPFAEGTLNRKICYQISKVEKGDARELYNNSGDILRNMHRNMSLVASLNDRVKFPYIEFVLSSPIGEAISDEKFVEVGNEYMERMGYADSCYTIIRNDDKDHSHVHILATTVDLNGRWVSDSYSHERSGRIMRELELKYGLEVLDRGKSSRTMSLGESQYRRYFFDTALRKAMRSHNLKDRITEILERSDNYLSVKPNMSKSYSNEEWKIILGDNTYETLLELLSKGRFFNPLFKDELLIVMDRLHKECGNVQEFRNRLEQEGYYMRLVSDKGKSYYVYGIPDNSFYLKDRSLPRAYRFGNITFNGRQMSVDEQKHYLYNQVFSALNASSSYEDFKALLEKRNILLTEHINSKGIYGMSFSITNIDAPVIFKSSDISRRLTYKSVQDFYAKDGAFSVQGAKQERTTLVDPVIACYANDRKEWEKDLDYMCPVIGMLSGAVLDNEFGKRRKEEEELPSKKRKRKMRPKFYL